MPTTIPPSLLATEEVVGAQARLHILEGDVVDFLSLAKGWSRSASIWFAIGLMSISRASMPSSFHKRMRFGFVPSVVAKPGMVTPMILVRLAPIRSKARTVTSSACVESRPPGNADHRFLYA